MSPEQRKQEDELRHAYDHYVTAILQGLLAAGHPCETETESAALLDRVHRLADFAVGNRARAFRFFKKKYIDV